MAKVSLSLVVALIALLNAPLSQAEDRFGLLYPEQAQRQAAMLEAKEIGTDSPLADPSAPLKVDASLLPASAILSESAIEEKAAEALAPVTLEEQIQDQRLDRKLEQFGYDIFTSIPTTFAPVAGIPVPPDYVIGPGDGFILQIFSGVDLQYDLVVTREGKLLLPEIGDIQVAGLTFEEAKSLIKESINRTRIGVKVVVTLSDLHSIQVMLVGEVLQPGSYTISGLSSLLNTLVNTGGIKRTGSLRDIQVKRNGKLVASLDLYELLLKGDATSNVYLRQGDVIFIPPIGRVVSIAGEVVRPAIYELKDEESLSEIIQMSGGLLPTADPEKTQIERIESSGSYSLIQASLYSSNATSAIKNGDLIRVFPVLDKVDRVVLLAGNVVTPGGYEWRPGMRVSSLIKDKSLLLQSTEFEVAAIERENREKKRTEVIYFNLGTALERPDSDADVELEARDKVMVFSTSAGRAGVLSSTVNKLIEQANASNLPPIVTAYGAVRHSGAFPLSKSMRFLDLVRLSGGVKVGVDRSYSLLVREDPATQLVSFVALQLELAIGSPRGDHNPLLKPGDRIYLFDQETSRANLIAGDMDRLRRQSRYGAFPLQVEVSGSVVQPGTYPLVPGMRVSDLLRAAGGMRSDAYGSAATVARKTLLEGQYSRTDELSISLTQNDPMLGGVDMILEPGDHLVLRQKPEWISKPQRVTISGEIKHPGTYEVDKRSTICSLVAQAGGFTEDAYLFGAVFTRESVRQREQEAINRIHRQMDDLLADLHMSPSVNKDSKLPETQSASDVYQVISRLKPEAAVGRMVIDLEQASVSCDENWDIALEDGDKLFIPRYQEEVSVVGQVYFPQSHQYRKDRAALDYINLSGGTKELAQREHAYIVQANGEVMSVRSPASTWGWLLSPKNVSVTPGSTIYVPLSVDRINGREFTESWIDLIYKLSISAASVDFLFGSN